ncbi:GYD domain-containing protein [Chelativorans xinjiangense]|uniref:GYD domain-containing protein n=1 Tax=Chelativorans xinjiangense TaxID=2681485 RepID=UPI001FE4BD93|nr:GYD domain-containing protein [Chelativorans xinjiangense]
MLTRLSHEAMQSPRSLENLSHQIAEHVRRECPHVHWQANYVILGPADYLDIFTAPDNATATKVATIIRTFGHATTEIWAATEWKQFVKLIRELPPSLVASS